jgi:hypothetical protein
MGAKKVKTIAKKNMGYYITCNLAVNQCNQWKNTGVLAPYCEHSIG